MRKNTTQKLLDQSEDLLNEARDVDIEDNHSVKWTLKYLKRSKTAITRLENYLIQRLTKNKKKK